MQKVVGSNPISRFFANPLHVGELVSVQVAETKWNGFGDRSGGLGQDLAV
jgi:hypothetical protein